MVVVRFRGYSGVLMVNRIPVYNFFIVLAFK